MYIWSEVSTNLTPLPSQRRTLGITSQADNHGMTRVWTGPHRGHTPALKVRKISQKGLNITKVLPVKTLQ